MSGVQSTASDIDVDLGRLFASLARRWKRIVFVALAVTALALGLAWLATPEYKAETRILIETRESVFTRPASSGEAERPLLDEEGITSQVEVIRSTDLLKQVAKKLNLSRLPEFDEAADMSLFSRLLVIAGLKNDPNEIPPEERVLKVFREKLTVYRVEKSRVIVIEMSSEDPKLAAEIPNALADAYIAVQGAAKQQSNSDATDWLEPEIANLSKRVKEAESRVANFRAQSDLLIGQNNSVLATQQLSELSTELSRVRANRGAAEANAQSVRAVLQSGASLDALPDVLSSTLIQRLRERQVQLKADIADLSTTLLDNHPRLRGLRSQLAGLDAQIRTEAENVLKGLGAEASTAQMREKQLVADLNALKAESARAGEEEVELRALEREANAQRELLESYLTRYREASSRRDGNYLPADARTFSRAIAPSEPYFPKVLPIAGAAFVASLLVMAIVTLLQELFSGRAMRPAAGTHLQLVEQAVMPRADPELLEVLDQLESAEAATAAREEPAIAIDRDEPEVVAGRAEPTMVVAVNDDRESLPATPKAAPAEEPELSLVHASGEVRAPISADSAPAARVEPIRREPLPEMRLRRESFREAWAEHKRREEEAAWREPAALDPMDEEDDDEEPIMRNPFARRKPAPMPDPVEPLARSCAVESRRDRHRKRCRTADRGRCDAGDIRFAGGGRGSGRRRHGGARSRRCRPARAAHRPYGFRRGVAADAGRRVLSRHHQSSGVGGAVHRRDPYRPLFRLPRHARRHRQSGPRDARRRSPADHHGIADDRLRRGCRRMRAGRCGKHPAAGGGRHRDHGQRDRAGRRSRGRGRSAESRRLSAHHARHAR